MRYVVILLFIFIFNGCGGGSSDAQKTDDKPLSTSVSQVSSSSNVEGLALGHLVKMSAASNVQNSYSFSITDQTTDAQTDYLEVLFSENIVYDKSLGKITIPSGVIEFIVTVSTIDDGLSEDLESYHLNIGGVVATGTIIDNDLSIDCASTYSDEVMQGRELYNTNCKVCHAGDARSGMFDIRGSVVADIDDAFVDVPDMVSLGFEEKLSSQQRGLISLYLIELVKDPMVELGNNCQNSSSVDKINLGSRLFFDVNLSLRKTLSCSSCHNPSHAFSDARFQQKGSTNSVNGALSLGDDGVTLGGRNAPTASYAQFTPAFGINADGEYFGGQFHDGRASTLKDQAKGPFLDKAEMMMPTAQSVVDRVLENPVYITDFKKIFGEDIFDDKLKAYDALAEAIESFEKTEVFAPFDSKYDRSRLPQSDENYYEMSLVEKKGYEIFFDSNRTNCVLCHTINSSSESNNELFSNFKYENIGTPKNFEALLARDSSTEKTDLGLGARADVNATSEYGKVRVPTLRNVAVTNPYMSNGIFKELRTVLAFYNHRSGEDNTTLNPETSKVWEDAEVSQTINHEQLKMELLSDEELDALEAFLKLLTDKQYETHIK